MRAPLSSLAVSRALLRRALRPRALLPALLVLACGEASTPAPAPVAAPTPVAAAPAPPVKPHGRVFLAATESGLIPIACHEAHVPKFSTGEPCLALAPVGSELRLESGALAKVTGTGPAACGGGQALVVTAPAEALRGHATAPSDPPFVETVPPSTPADALAAAPEGTLAGIAAAVATDHPTLKDAKRLQLHQWSEIDLDGDGKPEGLASVSLPAVSDEDDAPPAFAGIYLVPATEGARPRKIKGEPGGVQYTVLGAVDLDADGRPELWLNSYDDDGFAWSIEQVGSAQLTELGRWRCNA